MSSPAMPVPSRDVDKLAAVFGIEATWAGTMRPGALGPGSPELPTTGTLSGRGIADGFWYLCDIKSTAGAGEQALTWKGHFVAGWDASTEAFRAVLVDNLGMLVTLTGELGQDSFVATSVEALPLMGQMTRARFTWDFTDPHAIAFTNEHQIDGGPWQLWEEELITPKHVPV